MSITYYYAPMSAAVRTTWAIEELGLECERQLIDLNAKGTREQWYLAKNPNGKVPMLEIDGTPLFESTAILLYLGETYGVTKRLFPEPGMARAQAFQWMIWAQATFAEAAQRFSRNISPLVPEDQHNARAAEVARQDLDVALGILDRELTNKQYLVGDAFSFADIAVAGFLAWLPFLGVSYARWERVTAWGQRCHERPAYRRTFG
jgi:glutathione S-transferase